MKSKVGVKAARTPSLCARTRAPVDFTQFGINRMLGITSMHAQTDANTCAHSYTGGLYAVRDAQDDVHGAGGAGSSPRGAADNIMIIIIMDLKL